MKQTILLFGLFISSISFAQMTEIKTEKASDRKEIGKTYSILSKRDITLEKVENKYFVFSFNDNSYTQLKVPAVIILNESDENLESFYNAVLNNFENGEIKEKVFKSGNYTISVNYLGQLPKREIALLFKKDDSSKFTSTPFLSKSNWIQLFGKKQEN